MKRASFSRASEVTIERRRLRQGFGPAPLITVPGGSSRRVRSKKACANWGL